MPLFDPKPLFRLAADAFTGAAAPFAIAAAVASPFFLDDDNRGYFKTALLTTPAVIGITGMVSRGGKTARGEGERAGRFFKQTPFKIDKSGLRIGASYPDLAAAMTASDVDPEIASALAPALRRQARRFYAGLRSNRPVESITDIYGQIQSSLTRMGDKVTSRQLGYALRNAGLSRDSLAGMAGRTVSPVLLQDEYADAERVRKTAAGFRDAGDVRSLQSLSRELSRLRGARDPGFYSELGGELQNPFAFLDRRGTTELFARARGDLAFAESLGYDKELVSALYRLRSRKVIKGFGAIVTTGETSKILGYQLKLGKRDAILPIPDENGMVRMGSNLSILGVSRQVFDEREGEIKLYTPAEFIKQNVRSLERKQLSNLLERAHYWRATDPTDSFKLANFFDTSAANLSRQAIALRNLTAIPSPFLQERLAAREINPLDLARKLYRGGFRALGSQSGVRQFGFQVPGSEGLLPFGLQTGAKQAQFLRAYSKEFRPDFFPAGSPRLDRGYTTFARGLFGEAQHIPGLRAAIDPRVHSMLSDWGATSEKQLRGLLADRGITPGEEQFRSALENVRELATAPEFTRARQALATFGEGDTFLRRSFGKYASVVHTPLEVDELFLKPDFTGKLAFGTQIGVSAGLPVTVPSGTSGFFIDQIAPKIDPVTGRATGYSIDARKTYRLKTGSKIEADVKGLAVLESSGGQFKETVEMHNRLQRILAGSFKEYRPDLIPAGVNMLAPASYSANKVASPAEWQANAAARLIDEAGSELADRGLAGTRTEEIFRDITGKYGESLSRLHQKLDSGAGGTTITDLTPGELTDEQRASNMLEFFETNSAFFRRMGAMVHENRESFGDNPLFKSYLESGRKPSELEAFMQMSYQPVRVLHWGDPAHNLPARARVTWDVLADLDSHGMPEVAGALKTRGRAEGNVEQAIDFYFDRLAGMDFLEKPGKGAIVSLDEAGGLDLNLSSYNSRAGSIFDFRDDRFRDNFTLDLGRPLDVEVGGRTVPVRYLPQLGYDAAGAAPNLYDMQEVSASETERLRRDILENQKDPKALAGSVSDYLEFSLREGAGKGGVLRAPLTDTAAMSGIIQKGVTGTDPWTVEISPKRARSLPVDVRDALAADGEVYGVLARQPVSAAPAVRVRISDDPGISRNVIRYNEPLRGLIQGDDDADLVNLFFFSKQRHAAAYRQARAAITDPNSPQNRRMNINQALSGDGEVAASVASWKLTPYRDQATAGLEAGSDLAARMARRAEETAIRRTGPAGTIGAYSNLLERMKMRLRYNDNLAPAARSRLEELFWMVRQQPISAEAAKGLLDGEPDYMAPHARLQGALDGGDAGLLKNSLIDLSESYGKKTFVTSRTNALLGLSLPVGEERNVIAEALRGGSFDSDLETFASMPRGEANVADRAFRFLTSNSDLARTESLVSRLQDFEEATHVVPTLHGGVEAASGAARETAETLGTINRFLRGAGRRVGSAMRSENNGTLVALGLVAAAAGLATTAVPAAGSGLASANQFRPETTSGTADHVPGETVEGSRGSSPPIRELPPPAQVDTTVVAPQQNAVRVEVRARARDRQKAAEIQRTVQRLVGSDARHSMIVNRIDSWKTPLDRLNEFSDNS